MTTYNTDLETHTAATICFVANAKKASVLAAEVCVLLVDIIKHTHLRNWTDFKPDANNPLPPEPYSKGVEESIKQELLEHVCEIHRKLRWCIPFKNEPVKVPPMSYFGEYPGELSVMVEDYEKAIERGHAWLKGSIVNSLSIEDLIKLLVQKRRQYETKDEIDFSNKKPALPTGLDPWRDYSK